MRTSGETGKPMSTGAWVRTPAWDLFWLHSPLWMLPLVVVLRIGWPSAETSPISTLYLVLAGLFWIGHRFSSTWMAWMSEPYRPLLTSQRHRFLTVPAVVILATVLAILDPFAVLPGTALSRAIVIGGVDYLLVTWHFSAQHFGLLSLYRVRSGRTADGTTRTLDRAFAIGVGGGLIILAELLQGATGIPVGWQEALHLTAPLREHADALTLVGQGLAVVLTIALLVRERRQGPWGPRALYIVGMGGMVLAAFAWDPYIFFVFWTAQHWLAAMGLASQVVASSALPPPDARWHRLMHRINRSEVRWVLCIALLSLLTMPLYEVESSGGPDDRPGLDALGHNAATWLTSDTVLPWLLALGFATAFLHYLLDRAVWRLSDPEVRRAASGLMRPR